MASPKLTREQRETLSEWLAADYDSGLICKWCKERSWPELSRAGLSYYRKKHAREIAELRRLRHESALSSGLALKEERVARLKLHADKLEAMKWYPDDKGRYPNEKAWRETLDDIARELGHRSSKVDLSGTVGVNLAKVYLDVDVDRV